jgi:hypothetical protein
VGFEQREFIESFLTVGSRLGNEAPTFHHARDGRPLVGFVIDDQHASSPVRIHRLFQLSRQPELSCVCKRTIVVKRLHHQAIRMM